MSYSGKKKCHTAKVQCIINAKGTILQVDLSLTQKIEHIFAKFKALKMFSTTYRKSLKRFELRARLVFGWIGWFCGVFNEIIISIVSIGSNLRITYNRSKNNDNDFDLLNSIQKYNGDILISEPDIKYQPVLKLYVFFEENSDNIDYTYIDSLSDLVKNALKTDVTTVVAEGFSDTSEELDTSKRRIESVLKILTSLGLSESRIKAINLAHSTAVPATEDDELKKFNRRVRIYIG